MSNFFQNITAFSVFLFILKAAGVFFIVVNVFMEFKPIIAIFLWIKDLFKMDFHKFKGYGFWLYSGLGGKGKSISMVEYLCRMRKRYPDLKIYTNFYFEYADGHIDKWQDIVELENYKLIEISKDKYNRLGESTRVFKDGKYYKKEHLGIIFGFDEIHLTMNCRRWQDAPDNLLEYISQQRKLHKQIIASSQSFNRVDVLLREQANYVIDCFSLFGSRLVFNRFYDKDSFNAFIESKQHVGGKHRRRVRPKRRYSFVAFDSLREKYDTEQIMFDILEPKTKEHIYADRLSKKLR